MLNLTFIKKLLLLMSISVSSVNADQIEDIFTTDIPPATLNLTIASSPQQYLFDKVDGTVVIYHNSTCGLCRLIVSNGPVGVMGIVATPTTMYHIESDNTGTYLVDASTLTYPANIDDEVFVSPVQQINNFGIADSSIFQEVIAIQKDENAIAITEKANTLFNATESGLLNTYNWYDSEISLVNTILTSAENTLASDIANQSSNVIIVTDQQNVSFIQGIVNEDKITLNTLFNQYKMTASSIKTSQVILSKEQSTLTNDETAYRNEIAAIDNTGTTSIIDIMVVYTTENQTQEYALQRIQLLVAITNQAYLDSHINLKLRLVHTEPTAYTESNSNDIALSDLFTGAGVFSTIKAKQAQYGADLVYLFRPLNVANTGNCGMTYVEFANVSHSDARLGMGVIGDGYGVDNSKYYCGDNAFAHQIGHSLGLVHDRENSTEYGATPWSYAWDNHGTFPTIMSNNNASLMIFSNFYMSVECNGLPCGYPATNTIQGSDQTNTVNITAPVVARFQPSVTIRPIIQ